MYQSIPAVPLPPPPGANPWALAFKKKKWTNSPGWGRRKRANALPPGIVALQHLCSFLINQ